MALESPAAASDVQRVPRGALSRPIRRSLTTRTTTTTQTITAPSVWIARARREAGIQQVKPVSAGGWARRRDRQARQDQRRDRHRPFQLDFEDGPRVRRRCFLEPTVRQTD